MVPDEEGDRMWIRKNVKSARRPLSAQRFIRSFSGDPALFAAGHAHRKSGAEHALLSIRARYAAPPKGRFIPTQRCGVVSASAANACRAGMNLESQNAKQTSIAPLIGAIHKSIETEFDVTSRIAFGTRRLGPSRTSKNISTCVCARIVNSQNAASQEDPLRLSSS